MDLIRTDSTGVRKILRGKNGTMKNSKLKTKSNLIIERFDFIAKRGNWSTAMQLVIWKLIALQSIEPEGSLEEKILLFLGNLDRLQIRGIGK